MIAARRSASIRGNHDGGILAAVATIGHPAGRLSNGAPSIPNRSRLLRNRAGRHSPAALAAWNAVGARAAGRNERAVLEIRAKQDLQWQLRHLREIQQESARWKRVARLPVPPRGCGNTKLRSDVFQRQSLPGPPPFQARSQDCPIRIKMVAGLAPHEFENGSILSCPLPGTSGFNSRGFPTVDGAVPRKARGFNSSVCKSESLSHIFPPTSSPSPARRAGACARLSRGTRAPASRAG